MKLNDRLAVVVLKGYKERESYEEGVSFRGADDNMEEIKYHIDVLEEEGCLAKIEESLRNPGIGDRLFLTSRGHAILNQLQSQLQSELQSEKEAPSRDKAEGEGLLGALGYR